MLLEARLAVVGYIQSQFMPFCYLVNVTRISNVDIRRKKAKALASSWTLLLLLLDGYGEKRKKCCVFLSIQQLTNNLLEEEHMFRKNL